MSKNEYKFKGAYNPNTYFNGYKKDSDNETFQQTIGGDYVDVNKVKKLEKKKIKESIELKEKFHPKDDLLRGFTFEDLIITLQSNVQNIDKNAVMQIFKELYQSDYNDALYELKSNMNQIIKEAQG